MADLKYTHGTDVLAVRACYSSDASDLLAVAGEDTVQILQCVSQPSLEGSGSSDSRLPQGSYRNTASNLLHNRNESYIYCMVLALCLSIRVR